MTDKRDHSNGWDGRAAGWEDASQQFERSVQSLTIKMIEALAPRPGDELLELACGPGGTLPILAETVSPGGRVVAGDRSEGMVEAAKRKVAEAGLTTVDVEQLELDWIDLPTATFSGLFCRFGYMFASDPAAALIEARRVLRPSGRLAIATWSPPDENPYGRISIEALAEIGLGDPPATSQPGMFALTDAEALREMIFSAGFLDAEVERVEVQFTFQSFDGLIDWVFDVSQSVVDALEGSHPRSKEAFAESLRELSLPYTDESGVILLPGVTLLGTATA